MIHQLKIQHKYFEDMASGLKRFEVRYNDRDFKVGDFLALNELNDHKTKTAGEPVKETGRSIVVEVIYILENESYCPEGYVILGITPCMVRKTDSDMYNDRIDVRLKCEIYGGDNNEDVRSRAAETGGAQSKSEN